MWLVRCSWRLLGARARHAAEEQRDSEQRREAWSAIRHGVRNNEYQGIGVAAVTVKVPAVT